MGCIATWHLLFNGFTHLTKLRLSNEGWERELTFFFSFFLFFCIFAFLCLFVKREQKKNNIQVMRHVTSCFSLFLFTLDVHFIFSAILITLPKWMDFFFIRCLLGMSYSQNFFLFPAISVYVTLNLNASKKCLTYLLFF